MGFYYNTDQIAAMNNLSPRLVSSGVYLGAELDYFRQAFSEGNLGIAAKAYDVDALCKDGGAFSQRADTTAGLTFGYWSGRLLDGQTIVTIATGTILLPASQANVYIELLYTGGAWVVSQNTAGFTVGGVPLYLCSTAPAVISTVQNMRVLLEGSRDTFIVGKMLSTQGATKEIEIRLGTVNATPAQPFRLIMPDGTGKAAKASISVNTSIVQSDADYWDFEIQNKGPAGTGATKVVDGTANNNTTKATGGSVITANVARHLNLSAVGGATDFVANDVFTFMPTKHGAAADLVDMVLRVNTTFTN